VYVYVLRIVGLLYQLGYFFSTDLTSKAACKNLGYMVRPSILTGIPLHDPTQAARCLALALDT
jgi:hypothetical protein